mgnify:CR=1 FL=1
MYLEKMTEEEMGRFCDKLTIREMNNLYIILCEYYRMGNFNTSWMNSTIFN